MLRLLRITSFATHRRSRSQAFCSASGVGVTGLCPRLSPGVQRAALEDTRCRHQHLLRQVSQVMYDSYVVHCNILATFLLINHNLLLPACHPTSNNWRQRQEKTSRFAAKRQEPLRRLTLTFSESPGTIVFLGTKNLWRVKAYKSQICAMRWAVQSTVKTFLKVTLWSLAFNVPYNLYFIA